MRLRDGFLSFHFIAGCPCWRLVQSVGWMGELYHCRKPKAEAIKVIIGYCSDMLTGSLEVNASLRSDGVTTAVNKDQTCPQAIETHSLSLWGLTGARKGTQKWRACCSSELWLAQDMTRHKEDQVKAYNYSVIVLKVYDENVIREPVFIIV